ncbi:MAG TPA: transglutaminase-like cysteine peptidase [Rhizomicrobium sp.]|nr:transglutaminase-like cysteine peptidase [Rhizomicrobium sp.]
MTGSGDFAMFPFWQKVVSDMQPAAMAAAEPDPAPALVPAVMTDAPPVPVPATFSIGLSAGCTEERHCAPPEWLSFLAAQKDHTRLAQLEAVNQWANAKPYVEDWVNWHVADYWETPGEFIARGGDCEDFAIAKYFSLIRLGFSVQDLRIVVVSDARTHGFHAVLAARLDGTVWLLDNFLPAVVPMESQPQYSAVYSLNQQGWWMHSNPTVQLAGLTIVASPVTVDWQKVAQN